MKRTTPSVRPGSTETPPAQPREQAAASKDPSNVSSRIRLAFLDEYSCEKRGYDPYDTSRHRATPDVWVNKRKRA